MNANQLSKIMPRCPASYLAPLLAAMDEFGITGKADRNMFVATVAHESAQLNILVENLNYSADALRRVFRKYFPSDALANQYARQPSLIADRVYANRGGNGPEKSGDGWRYRGAGAIQLTFKDNHATCGAYFGIPVEKVSAWLRTPEGACRSAAWYWKVNNLKKYSDVGDFDGASDAVNRGRKTEAYGDSNGWADRLAFYKAAQRIAA